MRIRQKEGQGFVEYALLLFLITIVVLGSFAQMGQTVKGSTDQTSQAISDATGG